MSDTIGPKETEDFLKKTLNSSPDLVSSTVGAAAGRAAKPLWLSFTLGDVVAAGALPCLRSGEPVADAVDAAVRLGAGAVLFNCSSPEVMGAAVAMAAQALSGLGVAADAIRIGVYANAFVPLKEVW